MNHSTRRRFLKHGALGLAAAGTGLSLFAPQRAGAAAKVVIKYDWLMSNGQIGDVVAAKQGFFQAEGLDVEFSPGGPNSATVPPVVTGQALMGQFSDSAQLLLARSSGVPVKILACGLPDGTVRLLLPAEGADPHGLRHDRQEDRHPADLRVSCSTRSWRRTRSIPPSSPSPISAST
jgi:ABC-type nitrate/sulfonate/bicarbonate transport system substrate-binding protein